MLFRELEIPGVFLVQPDRRSDVRGFFARTFCEDEFKERGLISRFRQSSISFNARRGTVRGMHFSLAPHGETKIVRCEMGAIYDVVIDLRPGSPTQLRSLGAHLSSENRNGLYIPTGLAHGFQTLDDATEVLYMIDGLYEPGAAMGVRWNDPSVRVKWPEPVTVISERDLSFPDWVP